jgi:hypothetical protein
MHAVTAALATSLTLEEFVGKVAAVADAAWPTLRDPESGDTPLHAAASTGRHDVLRWLLTPPRTVPLNALNKRVSGCGRFP